ncbi:KilA-N domain-containing protein [Thiovulum sp. ES]|nr:KilA-N domain-containing protein [Thiovulum sp. ES]
MDISIISKTFSFKNTSLEIDFSLDESIYLNATKVAEAFGKDLSNWKRSAQTKEYIDALVSSVNFTKLNISEKDLFKVVLGKGKTQGTWIHKKLIISFARWLDAKFSVWCDEVIEEILSTSSYSLQKEKKANYSDLISETKEVLQLIDLMKDLSPQELFYLQKIMGENSPTKLLGNSFKNSYFLPTEIGKMVGMSGAEINLILEKKGFQFRDDNGILRPTLSGKEFCLEIGNQFNQLKWKLETIL